MSKTIVEIDTEIYELKDKIKELDNQKRIIKSNEQKQKFDNIIILLGEYSDKLKKNIISFSHPPNYNTIQMRLCDSYNIGQYNYPLVVENNAVTGFVEPTTYIEIQLYSLIRTKNINFPFTIIQCDYSLEPHCGDLTDCDTIYYKVNATENIKITKIDGVFHASLFVYYYKSLY